MNEEYHKILDLLLYKVEAMSHLTHGQATFKLFTITQISADGHKTKKVAGTAEFRAQLLVIEGDSK